MDLVLGYYTRLSWTRKTHDMVQRSLASKAFFAASVKKSPPKDAPSLESPCLEPAI